MCDSSKCVISWTHEDQKRICLSRSGDKTVQFNLAKFEMAKTHPCEDITMQLEALGQFSERTELHK